MRFYFINSLSFSYSQTQSQPLGIRAQRLPVEISFVSRIETAVPALRYAASSFFFDVADFFAFLVISLTFFLPVLAPALGDYSLTNVRGIYKGAGAKTGRKKVKEIP